jgi:ribosomal protein L40E
MVICPQCNIEHEAGEEFCRKCGSFLLPVEDPTPREQKTNMELICPRCQLLYKKGNYCRKCGSLLMGGTFHLKNVVQPLEKKSTKRWAKEWLRLLEEERVLESCMSKLEAQRNKVSSNVLNAISLRYKDRLESLSPLHQEIEAELESIKKRASEEMDFLEKELEPIRKRIEEFQSLYKLGALTKPDFVREKKELRREIKSRERSLRKYRQILSLLPSKMGGCTVSSRLIGDSLRPLPLLAGSVVILLMVAGGYFFWERHSKPDKPPLKEIVTIPSTLPSSNTLPAETEGQEVKKIDSLFENIRQANLQKNINLFMSCFSRDFNGMEGKRLDTLKMWENYNYLDLSYDLKKQTISGDTAHVRLEWLIKTSRRVGGQPENSRTVLDVTLKREDGRWKIKEIKPIS